LDWIDQELEPKRPYLKDWLDTAVCDEFYFGIGPQETKRVKRKRGYDSQYKEMNIHRKKVTLKDTKAKAWEEKPLKLLNVFVVIGYNYRRIVPYEVPNNVGKMTGKVYTEVILPTIKDNLLSQGLTLIQDSNSAHIYKATTTWAENNGLSLLTLPSSSPNFSILESMAQPLRKKFYVIQSHSEKATLARFTQIFEREMDQKQIQGMYKWYTKRFHEYRDLDGQMTRY
jgi:hypothetical protein